MKFSTKKMTLSALMLALALFLPFLTGQIPQIGSMLAPMHIPILLCGFVCGPFWAAGVGVIAPLLRYLLFGMPPIYPVGIAMCFELCVYGLVSGFMYLTLKKTTLSIYISLIAAMLCGRIVWGAAMAVIMGVSGGSFTMAAFISGAFTTAIPGIIVHIVLIPVIVLALQKARLIEPSPSIAA